MLINSFVFISILSSIFFPAGYTLIPHILGLWGWRTSGIRLAKEIYRINKYAIWFIASCWMYSLVSSFIDLYHGAHLGAFEIYIPFIIVPGSIFLYYKRPINFDWFFIASSAAACIGLGYSIYAHIILQISRPTLLASAISFGNISILLAITCAIGFLWNSKFNTFQKPWKTIMIFGIMAGISTSLLSGSKGGWFTVISIFPIFGYMFLKGLSKTYITIILTTLTLALALVFFHSGSPVNKRLLEAYEGYVTWSTTNIDSDGSVGARLSMWSFGVRYLNTVPLIGHGRTNTDEIWHQSALKNETDISWAPKIDDSYVGNSLHNELLTVYYWRGLPGIILMLSIYWTACLAFLKQRQSVSKNIQSLANLGLLTLIAYVEFGLTDSGWFVNANRQIFMNWITILIGSLLMRQD